MKESRGERDDDEGERYQQQGRPKTEVSARPKTSKISLAMAAGWKSMIFEVTSILNQSGIL